MVKNVKRGDIVKRDKTPNSFFTGVVMTVFRDLDGHLRCVLQDPVTRSFAFAEQDDLTILVPFKQVPPIISG